MEASLRRAPTRKEMRGTPWGAATSGLTETTANKAARARPTWICTGNARDGSSASTSAAATTASTSRHGRETPRRMVGGDEESAGRAEDRRREDVGASFTSCVPSGALPGLQVTAPAALHWKGRDRLLHFSSILHRAGWELLRRRASTAAASASPRRTCYARHAGSAARRRKGRARS